jgi:hypothetical protein
LAGQGRTWRGKARQDKTRDLFSIGVPQNGTTRKMVTEQIGQDQQVSGVGI